MGVSIYDTTGIWGSQKRPKKGSFLDPLFDPKMTQNHQIPKNTNKRRARSTKNPLPIKPSPELVQKGVQKPLFLDHLDKSLYRGYQLLTFSRPLFDPLFAGQNKIHVFARTHITDPQKGGQKRGPKMTCF